MLLKYLVCTDFVYITFTCAGGKIYEHEWMEHLKIRTLLSTEDAWEDRS